MDDMGKQFVAFMSHHLVALQIDCEYEDEDTHNFGSEIFSGFILALYGRWYWATAGHCLRDVDQAIEEGRLRVYSCGFADFFGADAPNIQTVPFTYERGCGRYITKKELGLDFGVIPLPDLIAQNMRANKILPIARENWVHQPSLTFSVYKMLGFPSHLIAELGGLLPTMIHVERIDPKEVDEGPAETWFAGRISPEAKIKSIKGMSGGPIFGFRQAEDGRWYYHVVALQSWWRPDSRIVFGCSVPLVAELLHLAFSVAPA